jgi:hypothetical protein
MSLTGTYTFKIAGLATVLSLHSMTQIKSVRPRHRCHGSNFSVLYERHDILPPSKKRCNYGMRASQTDSSLTKFIVNSINIYVFK